MDPHTRPKKAGRVAGGRPKVRVRLAVLAMVIGLVIAAGAAQRAAVAQATVSVSMGDFFFDPNTVTISVGDTVTWTNDGEEPHTSTSGVSPNPDGTWDSGIIDAGGSFSQTFTSAGTFEYFCTVHPTLMSGTVVVEEAATTTTAETTTTAAETTTTAAETTTTAAETTTTTGEVTTTVEAPAELPATGSSFGVMVGVALAALILGSFILSTARSRRQRPD